MNNSNISSSSNNWVKVVQDLSKDIQGINLDLISKDLESLTKFSNKKDQYFFLADICQDKSLIHPSWLLLAGRIKTREIKEEIPKKFSDTTKKMKASLNENYFNFVMNNKEELDSAIIEERDWKFNIFAIETLLKSYLSRIRKDKKTTILETPQYMWLRVATYLWFPNMKRILKTYDDLSLGNYIHASPTLFNAGTYRPQLASCFLLTVDDSTESIVKNHGNVCFISKNSGGIGLDVTSLRHSDIGKDSFVNEGIIPWMRMFNEALKGFNQGGKRKGSGAIYLRCWHIDIEEFLDLRKATGPEDMRARELFYALWVSDEFMRRVRDDRDWTIFCPNKVKNLDNKWGIEFEMAYKEFEMKAKSGKMTNFRTIRARELWKKIILTQIETGMPYILYADACNRKSNQKNLGTIKSSNLCVSGNTFVLTDKGQFQIKDIEGKKVNIWNGKEWSSVTPKKTGKNQDLIRVNLSNGMSIDCTPYHKFYIQEQSSAELVEIKAEDLSKNMVLANLELPPYMDYENPLKVKYPYTCGYICGAGYESFEGGSYMILKGKKKNFIKQMDYKYSCTIKDTDKALVILPDDICNIYSIPQQASLQDRIKWLEGLCNSCAISIQKGLILNMTNSHFTVGIKLFLQTLGVDARINRSDFTIYLDSNQIDHLFSLGFFPKNLKLYIQKIESDLNVKVLGIEDSLKNVDTFCFNEPKRHMGIFNGILTGQCSEIIEYTDKDNVASCNLASVALNSCVVENEDLYFDFKKLERITADLVRNLNQVIDRNYYIEHVPEIKNCNMRNRPIGIGVQGLADVFAMLDLTWESQEASQLNKDIFETMYYASIKESIEIAKEEGIYETFKGSPASQGLFQFDLWNEEKSETEISNIINKTPEEVLNYLKQDKSPRQNSSDRYDWEKLRKEMITYGCRNSLLLALMPTASTANILGNNEAFEPYTQHIYTRSVLSGQFVIINRHLVKDLEALGLWNRDTVKNINQNLGSIKNLPTENLPKGIANRIAFLKKKYKTVFELPQKTLLQLALDRGIYICQSQSFNCWMANPTFTKLNAYHFYAWKKGAKTGMYYLRQPAQYNPIDFSTSKREICTDEVCISCSS